MSSVGAVLRSERESQHREVAEIADALCITHRYLRAIEADDVKSLPGVFFYKSFVKQYAAMLRMDDAKLQSGIEALTSVYAEPAEPLPPADSILAEANRRYFSNPRIGLSMATLAAVVLACSGFYSWWTKPAHAASHVATTARAPQVSMVRPTAEVAADVPALNVTTTTGADGIKHVVLNLSAKEKTWLSITSEGKSIFSGVLEASQTKTLTALEAATMMVGNAGGIEVELNGKPIGPIGKSGQVVRVRFNSPDNFEILQPPPPPSETL